MAESMPASPTAVTLAESDVPGALLSEPMASHTMPELKWWLLCRGIKVPTSWKKQKLLSRIEQAKSEQLPIVDVDGSYLYRKQQSLIESGITVLPLDAPSPPLSGWDVVTDENVKTISPKIPIVTSGTLYTYLAGVVGSKQTGAFRALTRGYNHWASGRLDQLQVQTMHPLYCHVRCTTTPSMKPGSYHVHILLGRNGQVSNIVTATCECAAGKSASCTHVSAVLHALVAMTTAGFQVQPATVSAVSDDEEEALPVTSYLCQWKVPKKRKESSIPMSAAVFEKHEFDKQKKRKISLIEDFDPRPVECRGIAKSLLPALLDSVRGESLGVSVLFDPQYCHNQATPVTDASIPSTSNLKETIAAFKSSLKLPCDKLRQIEQNTRAQRHSELWFSVRRYRITASRFGEILRRKPTTSPDAMVLSILQPRSFSSAATDWGVQNEQSAVQAYLSYKHTQGNPDIAVGPCGFLVSETHPFLGATPDGTIYDPSCREQPFGFLEVKCPYSHRDRTPLEAASCPGFCSVAQASTASQSNDPILQLRQNHIYFAQVQGQMAVGGRMWSDFVIFTNKGISVERIKYDDNYWRNTLLPKLDSFFDNCLAPEIVSPIHALGLPLRDLSK